MVTDVCLLSMPFSPVERPSYALGLLKAVLVQSGLNVAVRYPCVRFAEQISRRTYSLLSRIRIEDGPVDWAFSGIAFPDHPSDVEAYVARIFERNPILWSPDRTADVAALVGVRELAPEFIERTVDEVIALGPRIVGCTSTFQQHVASLALLRRLKERAPDIVTMIGGANCETVMGRTTHQSFPWIDYVVSGEAEDLLPGLCRDILAAPSGLAARRLPEGVFAPAHRDAGYPIASYGDGVPRAVAGSLQKQPMPDYDDYFSEIERSSLRQRLTIALPIETSRGCWWGEIKHCKFCGLNGVTMAYRSKPADMALSEITALQARYGVNQFLAVDNIIDLKYFNNLVPQLAEVQPKASFFYETKSNLSRAQVKALADAGVIWLQPGIESMHTGMLDLMDKGSQAWRNVQLLRYGRQFGVRFYWAILCGFPGEDEAWFGEMAEWLPLITHLEPGQIKGLRFDRYSPYFRDAKDYELTLHPSEMYRHFYPVDEPKLADLVYFFEAERRNSKGFYLLGADLSERPSLEGLRRVLLDWNRHWHSAGRPTMVMEDDGTVLTVTDTRPCALAYKSRLTGMERDLYLLCDDAPPFESAVTRIARSRQVSPEVVRTAIAQLLERRLLLSLDGHLIALAVPGPLPEMPNDVDFPGGLLFEDAATAATSKAAAND
ncbi:MAG TPA: RiPP maturation radical SAM C-methyltransferase [Stellaceae bacterium]|nr:RiPP maturation radical SAM C-methyltransferase [Stellaceae bacterium]